MVLAATQTVSNMGGGVRRPSLVTFALVPILLGLVGGLATSTVQVSGRWSPWVWAVTALLVLASVVIEVHRNRSGGQDPPSGRGTGLDEVADQLAQAVGAQWRREEERRRVHDPFPLPLRWKNAPAALMDHPANVQGAPAGVTPEPLDLTGELDQIAEIYQRIPAKRLVILGGSGSGKTVLAVRLVLDLLEVRATTDRVPVIFSLSSWNPVTESLRDWLADRLIRDYPGLVAAGPGGSSLAAELVAAERMLPVLDGFDEIAEGLRRAALEALNGTTLPLVLTSRPDQYAAAVGATDVLTSAAGIKLTALTSADLVDYLPRTTRRVAEGANATVTVWERVLNELRDRPQSDLAGVLRTPLMVVLARTIYSDTPDHDPWELLDTDRFPTPDALEDHLLATFIPTVYRHRPGDRRRWDPERVRRWLSYLAQHLDHRRDIAWWQLGSSRRRSSRTLVVGTAVGLAFGLVVGVVRGISRGFEPQLLPGGPPWTEPVVALLAGLVVGSAFGLANAIVTRFGTTAVEPSRVRMQILGGTRGRTRRVRKRFNTWFVFGLAFGLVLGLVNGALKFALGLVNGGLVYWLQVELGDAIVFGLVFGLVVGLMGGLLAWLETPLDIGSAVSPSDLLRMNRKNAVFQLLLFGSVFGLMLGLVGALVAGLAQQVVDLPVVYGLVAGLAFGLVGGLGGGLGYVLSLTAWGQWAVLARLWLPLTGQLPWAALAFLDDACERGVLRQAGAFYQFRHARLQDHLTRHQDLCMIATCRTPV
jgi:hypothetical protein